MGVRRRETLQIQIDQTEMREQVSGRFGRIRIERVRCGCGNSRECGFWTKAGPREIKWGHKLHKRGAKKCKKCTITTWCRCLWVLQTLKKMVFYLYQLVLRIVPLPEINISFFKFCLWSTIWTSMALFPDFRARCAF